MKEDPRPHLATLCEKTWASSFSDDPDKAARLLAGVADDRRRLAGPDPSPLESALAERAALALMECRVLDVLAATLDRKGAPGDAKARVDRRRTNAHRRLTSGLLALARVRRLQRSGS